MAITNQLDADIVIYYSWLLYQGRNGGIESLRISHVSSLMKKKYALSREFKTRASLKYQPFLLSSRMRKMLVIYLNFLRPAVAGTSSPSDEDPLWLAFSGEPLKGIGRRVKLYFLDHNLDITPTRLRGIVETYAEEQLRQGKITSEQRAAISVISGHSCKTAQDYYTRTNMHGDIMRGVKAFAAITGSSDDADANSAELDDYEDPDYEADTWASSECGNHPSSDLAPRAVWTDGEKNYLLKCAAVVQREAAGRKIHNLVSTIRKRIFSDRTTRNIFHQRHVLTPDRLRIGIHQFLQMQQ
jgi:hypothetical protein